MKITPHIPLLLVATLTILSSCSSTPEYENDYNGSSHKRVRSMIKVRIPLIRECHKRYAGRKTGKVKIKYAINNLGEVLRSEIIHAKSDSFPQRMFECMRAIINKTEFGPLVEQGIYGEYYFYFDRI